jgi:hypothetical protein
MKALGNAGGELPGVQQSMSGGQKPVVFWPSRPTESGARSKPLNSLCEANLLDHPRNVPKGPGFSRHTGTCDPRSG